MPEPQLSSRALCTVEDVRMLLPGVTDRNTRIEPKIIVQINAESKRIHDRSRREFKPRLANPSMRRFDVGEYDAHPDVRSVPVGDLAGTVTLVEFKSYAGVLLATVVAADYVLLPRDGDREPEEPYSEMWFPASTPAPAPIVRRSVLEVTATWGYPSVPETVKDECAANCAAKIMRRLPTSAIADEEGAQQQLRVSYRVTDSHRAPRG